jgi:hypothetical protein
MSDLLFILLTLLFFASCFGLIALCRALELKK